MGNSTTGVFSGFNPAADALINVGDGSTNKYPHATDKVTHEYEAEEKHRQALEGSTDLQGGPELINNFIVLF